MSPICCFFASSPKGTDDLLAEEIRQLGGDMIRNSATGVYFEGALEVAYKVCLWSRMANRVLLDLTPESERPFIDSADDLYRLVKSIAWEEHIAPNGSLAVDFVGANKAFNNELFGAAKAKDAIVDRLRDTFGERPNVDKDNPDVRVSVRLHRDKASVAIDLSGESLHRRGYRADTGIAPLKENLAAAMLVRAGWPTVMVGGGCLIDPMCGSGTFLIEAAWMRADIAPGLGRTRWGFSGWKQHQADVWQSCLDEAEARKAQGLQGFSAQIAGFDADERVLRTARTNIRNAGLANLIQVSHRDIANFDLPEAMVKPGIVITNPPYGERLGEIEDLKETYLTLAKVMKAHCSGWTLAVLTGNAELAREMRLRPRRRNKFMNGPIPSELLISDIMAADQATLRSDNNIQDMTLSEGAEMVFNRINKNRRKLAKWIKQNNIACYRVYDADMPEYAAAIDVYGKHIHVQEYQAPKSVNEQAAKKRLRELVMAAAKAFNLELRDVPVKTRQQNKGSQQYERLSQTGQFIEVQEGKAKLRVNLYDYLDAGLFLDHRPLRLRIARQAMGKSFLNLFCYTATATVHAALAGATKSVSVDMSHTYLDWAKKNFELNHINATRHELVQEDCIKWLNRCRQGFDLIMLDPPSFSNSKRMEDVLDIQRDHVSLISRCMELLNPGGTLYFSTNLRSFKCDFEALSNWQVNDISADTLDVDFERNPKIHYCFDIRHK